ncbi:hypothetical protein AGMMS49546_38440 [Spirochaetia bacterium]|nr:hypothetical protein AGMMS49546_38440 [Spirochaetia bacterium]
MKRNVVFSLGRSAMLVLAFGLVLAGCGGGATGAKALVGTWEEVDFGLTWSFTGNEFTQDILGVKITVPYKIKGNSISTTYEGAEIEMEFEINGDTLTIEIMGLGLGLEFERVK